MKTKNILLVSLLIMVVYIAYLKVLGLNDIDYSNLVVSIKPFLPHSLALAGAFIFNVVAYRSLKPLHILAATVLSILSAVLYFPTSLAMLIPAGVLVFAYMKINDEKAA